MQNLSENKKSSFFYAFALLPKREREAMNDFYTFAHLSDEIADNTEKPIEEKKKEFADWKEQFNLGLKGKSHFYLLNRIGDIIREFNLDVEIFNDLFSGMEDDLNGKKITTFLELENYAYKVASTIGLVIIEILGYNNPDEKKFAVNLGKALQITNIMRDVKKDYFNSRIYIPEEIFEKYGYSAHALSELKYNDSFLKIMTSLGEKSHNFFDEAFSYFDDNDYKTLYPAVGMGKIYYELLRKIEDGNYNVLHNDFSVSKIKKLSIIFREIIKGKTGI